MPAIYDRLARYYDQAFAPLEKLGLARMRAETLSLIPTDSRVLELGAGTGANFEYYPASRQAVASEFSIRMLEIASGRLRGQHLVQANAENLPFPDDHFDAAFATLVFCSIPRPDLAFAELRRTVRPGGIIVLLEHVRPPGLLGHFFDALNVATVALVDDHFNRKTGETAEAAGLEIIEVRQKLFGIVNLIVCRVED